MIQLLKKEKIDIIKTYYCPHIKEDGCDCRKPKTKYAEDIINEYGIDTDNSWMIGDHPSDTQFGISAGFKAVFLTTGHGDKHLEELNILEIKPTLIINNFFDVAKEILKYS